MSNREVFKNEERELVEELDREVDRKGSLFALLACLAIVAGLALSTAIAFAGAPS